MTAAGGLHARIVVSRGSFALDVALDIEPGTTAALVGPNGAGKSTVVDVLAGVQPLHEGRLELDGRVLDDPAGGVFVPSEERRVGVVFQRDLLFGHLDVVDNIAFGPSSRGLRRREARAIARRWIEELDISALAGRRPDGLSGGEVQRVALARALAIDPDLLLLDEPLAAVDVAARTDLRRTLREHLARYDGPRLIITHDPTDAFLLADHIHVLEDGRLTQHGVPDEIRHRPATSYVAALAGVNLLTGVNAAGTLSLDDHPQDLQTADTHTTGPVLVTIRPNAIALHADEPHGSPRNTWHTTVDTVEPLGEITRVGLAAPLPLSADITPGSATAMDLAPGTPVWVSIKATEINVNEA